MEHYNVFKKLSNTILTIMPLRLSLEWMDPPVISVIKSLKLSLSETSVLLTSLGMSHLVGLLPAWMKDLQ